MLGELARSPRNKGRKAAKRLVEIRPLAGYRVPRPIEAVVFSPAIYALLHPETLLPIARQRLSLFVFVQTLLFLERMRIEGVDFLQKNAAIAEEVRRILVDLDEVEKELKRAAKAIDAAAGLTGKYRVRLHAFCDNTGAPKKMPQRQTASDSRIAKSQVVKTCGA
jgi:hypothetical protein